MIDLYKDIFLGIFFGGFGDSFGFGWMGLGLLAVYLVERFTPKQQIRH